MDHNLTLSSIVSLLVAYLVSFFTTNSKLADTRAIADDTRARVLKLEKHNEKLSPDISHIQNLENIQSRLEVIEKSHQKERNDLVRHFNAEVVGAINTHTNVMNEVIIKLNKLSNRAIKIENHLGIDDDD